MLSCTGGCFFGSSCLYTIGIGSFVDVGWVVSSVFFLLSFFLDVGWVVSSVRKCALGGISYPLWLR